MVRKHETHGWITLTGVPASIVRAVLATVLLAVGALIVSTRELGSLSLQDQEALAIAGFGALLVLLALYSYVQAIRKNSLTIRIGRSEDGER